MRRRLLPIPLMVLGLFAATAAAAGATEYSDFNELDLEALLNQTIVTAAKHDQRLSDAPVAATVITAEEIGVSGARSIPEVLRMVPGLDVMQIASSTYDVSARGLNKPGSNAMLVLVDGRSVYVDFYGLTVWNQLTVNLEDIKVIEVIKGPGSAMHGANAFAGVINIITYTPDEKPGTSARTMVSDLGEGQSALRHADRRQDVSWKVNAAWDHSSDWQIQALEADNVRFDGQLRYDLAADSRLAVGAGFNDGSTRLVVTDVELIADGSNGYARADYSRGDLSARWYANMNDMRIEATDPTLAGARGVLESYLHDLELQYALRPGRTHHLVCGASYRNKRTSYNDQNQEAKEEIFAGFLLEEWSPHPHLRLSGGLRYEHHSLVGGHLSPRGGLVFKPTPRHHLRLSYSKAYRDPTYLETYWRTEVELVPGLAQTVRGDQGNESEQIESFELGYQGLPREDLLLSAALFLNRMDRLIAMRLVADFPSPPAPWPGIPAEWAFLNGEYWEARGGEAGFRLEPWTWLSLGGQYSYVWLENVDTGRHVKQAPVHAASLLARLRLASGRHLQLAGRYRGESSWSGTSSGARSDGRSDQRLVLDAAWQVLVAGDGHRLNLAVDNILDNRFRDHPLAIEQRRRWFASVTIHF